MRLIMRVHRSGWDYSYTNVFPVVYSSKEDFLSDLEIAFHYWNDSRKEREEQQNSLDKQFREKMAVYETLNKAEKKEKYFSEHIQPIIDRKSQNHYLSDKITVGNTTVMIDDIYEKEYGYLSPDVFTVDEFFQNLENV